MKYGVAISVLAAFLWAALSAQERAGVSSFSGIVAAVGGDWVELKTGPGVERIQIGPKTNVWKGEDGMAVSVIHVGDEVTGRGVREVPDRIVASEMWVNIVSLDIAIVKWNGTEAEVRVGQNDQSSKPGRMRLTEKTAFTSGRPVSAEKLPLGQFMRVVGLRLDDGTIQATRVLIEDAARIQPFEAVEFAFVHDASKVSRKYLPESVAGGVALLDYDGDGLLDVYFVNGAAVRDPMPKVARADKSAAKYWNRLYRNLGGGKFEDVTERAGVKGAWYGMGAAAADFDNDGHVDLYVTGFGGNELFRNRGDGTFEEIGEAAGVRGGGWSTGAAWVDVDGDGKLDLAVARYAKWDYEPDIWCGPKQAELRSYCNPEQFPAETHLLFRNLGGGKFADVSKESGFGTAPGRGLGVAIADFDQDGRIDIAVANDAAPQQLFRNVGGGSGLGGVKFTEVGFDSNIAYDDNGRVFSGMGIDWGDVDGDGRDELVVNALAQQRYALFRWTGGKGGGPAAFEYASAETGLATLSRNHSGWGMKLADMDNDGRVDLVTAQGHVMDNIERTQPAVKYRESMALWRNAGGKFVNASGEAGAAWLQPRAARGAAFGDLDNDGLVDVVVLAQGEHAVWFRNRTVGNHWLMVKLVGSASNRDGIGARVRVRSGGRDQWRTVSTGGSYLSSNDVRAHFGLGAAGEDVEAVEVQWPSGRKQTVTGVKADRILTLREPL
ncbi:MAG: CRTAC1 family protein [Acidobacteriota bacterium]